MPRCVCPITRDLMRDPVICADGNSYEREAIEQWFAAGRWASPLTNERLAHRTLIPNLALQSVIEDLQRRVMRLPKKISGGEQPGGFQTWSSPQTARGLSSEKSSSRTSKTANAEHQAKKRTTKSRGSCLRDHSPDGSTFWGLMEEDSAALPGRRTAEQSNRQPAAAEKWRSLFTPAELARFEKQAKSGRLPVPKNWRGGSTKAARRGVAATSTRSRRLSKGMRRWAAAGANEQRNRQQHGDRSNAEERVSKDRCGGAGAPANEKWKGLFTAGQLARFEASAASAAALRLKTSTVSKSASAAGPKKKSAAADGESWKSAFTKEELKAFEASAVADRKAKAWRRAFTGKELRAFEASAAADRKAKKWKHVFSSAELKRFEKEAQIARKAKKQRMDTGKPSAKKKGVIRSVGMTKRRA